MKNEQIDKYYQRDFIQNGMKNCPFCGKRPKLITRSCNSGYWKVHCADCMSEKDSREEALNKWNNRVYGI
jgi:hypothetical protein